MSNQNQTQFPQLVRSVVGSKVFKSADHADNISHKLWAFYEGKEFFDVELIACVDNTKVQAHRIVLSASSDYFMTMFRSYLREAKADKVELNEINGVTLKLIIDFMYTGSIDLSCETVEIILRAADFLQMKSLMVACCDFMRDHLDTSNCLGIALFAEQHNYTVLYKEALSFASVNFDKVCCEEEFVRLDEEQLEKLISSDELYTYSEEKVFQSLVRWVEYDKRNREKLILRLLLHIRFALLRPKFIIENRHSVCKTVECYELICSWLQWHLSAESRSKFPTANTKARKSNQKLAFVDEELTKDFKVKTFNRDLDFWSEEELPSPSKERSSYACIVINNKMIIAGGTIDDNITNTVECLDLKTHKWTDLPSMHYGREGPVMAVLNDDLYVIGGYGDNCLRSVEKYNFSTQEWQDVVPMNTAFDWIRVAVDEGHLYVAGLSSHVIECFDVVANKWTQIANKNGNFCDFGIAAVDGHLYAIGGGKGKNESTMVERYNPSTHTWTSASPLKVGRRAVNCIAINNRIIVLGGYDGKSWVGLVEEYDPETNEWSALASLMPHEIDRNASVFTMQSKNESNS